MPPLRPPKLNDEQLLNAIALAPEDTVRAVLRTLTGNNATKSRIATLMAKLPLGLATPAAGNGRKPEESSKKRKAPTTQICVRCGKLFEEGDTSKTCRYHPDETELDYGTPAWRQGYWPHLDGRDDNEHMRKLYPNGFRFRCCGALGTEAKKGCKLGRHRAEGDDEETEVEFDESEEDWDDNQDEDEDKEDEQDGEGRDKVKSDGDQKA